MSDRQPTVLLVDDAATMRLLMRALLGPEYAYLEAENGAAAFEVAKQHLPDFVLMDLHMPVADGMEGLRLLKADPVTAPIPVIMLTTDGTMQRRAQCRALGCSEFLTKPVDRAALYAVARRYIPR